MFSAPVSIVDAPENTTANSTTQTSFLCLVEGSHMVTLTWRNGSEPVMEDRPQVVINIERVNRTFHRSTLTIQSLEVTDAALYSCNAENVLPMNASFFSSASHQFSLFVQSE